MARNEQDLSQDYGLSGSVGECRANGCYGYDITSDVWSFDWEVERERERNEGTKSASQSFPAPGSMEHVDAYILQQTMQETDGQQEDGTLVCVTPPAVLAAPDDAIRIPALRTPTSAVSFPSPMAYISPNRSCSLQWLASVADVMECPPPACNFLGNVHDRYNPVVPGAPVGRDNAADAANVPFKGSDVDAVVHAILVSQAPRPVNTSAFTVAPRSHKRKLSKDVTLTSLSTALMHPADDGCQRDSKLYSEGAQLVIRSLSESGNIFGIIGFSMIVDAHLSKTDGVLSVNDLPNLPAGTVTAPVSVNGVVQSDMVGTRGRGRSVAEVDGALRSLTSPAHALGPIIVDILRSAKKDLVKDVFGAARFDSNMETMGCVTQFLRASMMYALRDAPQSTVPKSRHRGKICFSQVETVIRTNAPFFANTYDAVFKIQGRSVIIKQDSTFPDFLFMFAAIIAGNLYKIPVAGSSYDLVGVVPSQMFFIVCTMLGYKYMQPVDDRHCVSPISSTVKSFSDLFLETRPPSLGRDRASFNGYTRRHPDYFCFVIHPASAV